MYVRQTFKTRCHRKFDENLNCRCTTTNKTDVFSKQTRSRFIIVCFEKVRVFTLQPCSYTACVILIKQRHASRT